MSMDWYRSDKVSGAWKRIKTLPVTVVRFTVDSWRGEWSNTNRW